MNKISEWIYWLVFINLMPTTTGFQTGMRKGSKVCKVVLLYYCCKREFIDVFEKVCWYLSTSRLSTKYCLNLHMLKKRTNNQNPRKYR